MDSFPPALDELNDDLRDFLAEHAGADELRSPALGLPRRLRLKLRVRPQWRAAAPHNGQGRSRTSALPTLAELQRETRAAATERLHHPALARVVAAELSAILAATRAALSARDVTDRADGTSLIVPFPPAREAQGRAAGAPRRRTDV